MRRNLIATALFAAAAFVMPAKAHAATQFGLTLTSPACTDLAKSVAFNYTRCLGSFAGNDRNQNISSALADFGAGFTFVGKSDDSSNPFTTSPSGTSGQLTFINAPTGPFVLILKSSNQFSMYYFETPVSTLTFDMIGTATNRNGQAQELSHASLYTTSVNVVPEPSTYALMATGLLGLGAAARRRRKA